MKNFQTGRGIILVNDTEKDFLDENIKNRDILETCITELVDLDDATRRKIDRGDTDKEGTDLLRKHSSYMNMIIREHQQGNVLLSPYNFKGVGDRVTNRGVEQILKSSSLGRSFAAKLSEVGLFEFIKSQKNDSTRIRSQRLVNLLLASIAMSMGKAKTIDEVPASAFVAWLRFYREPIYERWRPELWSTGRDSAFQALREVTLAFSRYSGDDAIAKLAGQVRSDVIESLSVRSLRANTPPEYKQWLERYDRWLASRAGRSKSYNPMFTLLMRWLNSQREHAPIADPRKFLLHEHRSMTFLEFLCQLKKEEEKKGTRDASRFLNHFRVAREFSLFLEQEVDGDIRPISIVSDKDLLQAPSLLDDDSSPARTETASRPLPSRLYELTREILEEGESGWPGQVGLCRGQVQGSDGTYREIYCPVLPTLYLMLFYIPLRVGQAKRLDSGEADSKRFNASSMTWASNTGPHKNYWKRRGGRGDDRGYARQVGIDPPLTGIFVNTNKTGAPYVVPWQNGPLHKMLYDLVRWQETWNPIKSPITPMDYVEAADEEDKNKLNELPTIFPLFRMPGVSRKGIRGAVPSARQTYDFWLLLMAEVERRWNERNPENPINIVERKSEKGQIQTAKYNPHGLRVAGITLMLEQRVPIEIISKVLAGHKTVLMTLFYAKFDYAVMHSHLERTTQTQEAALMRNEMNELASLNHEEAIRRTAAVNPNAVGSAFAADTADRILWNNVGIGICPWDGTRCHDGGECLRKETVNGRDKSTYGPVPGGERNCILCRHFITSPIWEPQLRMYGTLLNRRLAVRAERVVANDVKLSTTYQLQGVAEDLMEQTRIERDMEFLRQEELRLTSEVRLLDQAIWNTALLVEACTKIRTNGDGTENPMNALLVHDPGSVNEFVETSDFAQAAYLTEFGKLYPIMRDDEVETSFRTAVDRMFWNMGVTPISFMPGDDDDKANAYRDVSWRILKQFQTPEIRALETGAMRLQDLNIGAEIRDLVQRALGPPIEIMTHRTLPDGRLSSEGPKKRRQTTVQVATP